MTASVHHYTHISRKELDVLVCAVLQHSMNTQAKHDLLKKLYALGGPGYLESVEQVMDPYPYEQISTRVCANE